MKEGLTVFYSALAKGNMGHNGFNHNGCLSLLVLRGHRQMWNPLEIKKGFSYSSPSLWIDLVKGAIFHLLNFT